MLFPQQKPLRRLFPIHFLCAAVVMLAGANPSRAAQVTSIPPTLHFGSIVIGQTETLPATLTNLQSTSITVSAMTSTSSEFSVQNLKLPLIIPPGQTVSFNVVFAPTANGWSGGALTFATTASNGAIVIRIGGVGVASASLSANTSKLGFGSVAVGSSSTLPLVLTNTGTFGLAVAQTDLTGTGFSISGPNLPAMLTPGQSATFNVTFKPQSATSVSGSLYVPNGSLTIPLSGTGTTTSQLNLTPASLSFGNVDIGSSSAQPVTLSASGGDVTVSSSASSSSQFALQGATLPLTIPSGQSVTFSVAFTPSANGKISGTLSLASNASDSNAQEGLTGVGITAQSAVTVSWSASVSQVTGYNVYRGVSQTGSYSKINSALNPSTSFTDSTVTSGSTYYYVATAVNSSGEESKYSTPVQAQIP